MTSIPAQERAKAKRHELLVDFAVGATQILKNHGLSEMKAHAVADEIANCIVENWVGQHVAIPMDAKYRRAKRVESIKREFNGFNHQELALKHRMSTNGIYKILKRK